MKRGRGKSKGSGNRPQTALTPVQNRKNYKSRPKSAMPAVRPQTAILKNRSKPSTLKINTGSSKIRKEFTRSSNSFSNSRPHTVGPSPSRQRNPSTMKRSKSAGVFREHDGPEHIIAVQQLLPRQNVNIELVYGLVANGSMIMANILRIMVNLAKA